MWHNDNAMHISNIRKIAIAVFKCPPQLSPMYLYNIVKRRNGHFNLRDENVIEVKRTIQVHTAKEHNSMLGHCTN